MKRTFVSTAAVSLAFLMTVSSDGKSPSDIAPTATSLSPRETPAVAVTYRRAYPDALWNDPIYAAIPCGAPPLGQTSRVFTGVGHCLERYDRIWAGYCTECKFPALALLCAPPHYGSCVDQGGWAPGCAPCGEIDAYGDVVLVMPIEEGLQSLQMGTDHRVPRPAAMPDMPAKPELPSRPEATPIDMPPAPETPVEYTVDPVTQIDTPDILRLAVIDLPFHFE